MPVPQRVNFLVEQAGKPIHKKLIENGATSQYIAVLKRGEVCPMPYALCPMPYALYYLMLLRKAINQNSPVHSQQ